VQRVAFPRTSFVLICLVADAFRGCIYITLHCIALQIFTSASPSECHFHPKGLATRAEPMGCRVGPCSAALKSRSGQFVTYPYGAKWPVLYDAAMNLLSHLHLFKFHTLSTRSRLSVSDQAFFDDQEPHPSLSSVICCSSSART